MAPVVHLKYGLAHCKVLHPLPEFVVEHGTAAVHILVVDPDGQYKVHELPHRHLFSPRHLGTCLQGIVHVLQVEFGPVVGNVGKRHIGIKELHGLQPAARKGLEDIEITFVGNQFTTCIEILGKLAVLVKILAGRQRHHEKHRCRK